MPDCSLARFANFFLSPVDGNGKGEMGRQLQQAHARKEQDALAHPPARHRMNQRATRRTTKKGEILYILLVTYEGRAGNSTQLNSIQVAFTSFPISAWRMFLNSSCNPSLPYLGLAYLQYSTLTVWCWRPRPGTWDKGRLQEEFCFSPPNLVSLLKPPRRRFWLVTKVM